MSEQQPSRRTGGRFRLHVALLVVAALVGLAVTGGSAYAIAGIVKFEQGVNKICAGAACARNKADSQTNSVPSITPCVQNACNYLVIGSDSRQGISKKQQEQFGYFTKGDGQRSDTIMLVHIDLSKSKTVVLSIPRDMYVPIPGHGYGKINSALDFGPDVLVRTLENMSGWKINHFVGVDFDGFEHLVNDMGGVPICVDQPMHDSYSGLDLPHAGCYTLNGYKALAFVRSRHQATDLIPDFARITRQQQFLRAVIDKMLTPGELLKLPSLLQDAEKYLTIDSGLNLYSLQTLIHRLGAIGQQGVQFRSIPSAPFAMGGVDYVRMIQPSANQLFARIAQDKPLGSLGLQLEGTNVSPASVAVQVYDASSNGKAAQVQKYLQMAGFDVLPLRTDPAGYSRNRILYAPSAEAQQTTLAGYLPMLKSYTRSDLPQPGVLVVVIGPQFPGVHI